LSKSIQRYISLFILPALLLTACSGRGSHADKELNVENNISSPYPLQRGTSESLEPSSHAASSPPLEGVGGGSIDTPSQEKDVVHYRKSPTAHRFDSLGLVNIAELDSTIAVSLLYATPDNFVGEIMYDDLTEAYLHPEAAEALLKAQRLLKEKHPDYTLIIYDATRPMFAQRKMWDLVKGTSKSIYVSNPTRGGGLHNYGLAVDISILDKNGVPLDMGTIVDHLGPEAHITNEADQVRKGIITQQAKENRELLRSVMRGAGFRALHSEWWHFNLYSREVAKKNYKLID